MQAAAIQVLARAMAMLLFEAPVLQEEAFYCLLGFMEGVYKNLTMGNKSIDAHADSGSVK